MISYHNLVWMNRALRLPLLFAWNGNCLNIKVFFTLSNLKSFDLMKFLKDFYWWCPGTFSEPSQTSKMELFAEIFNGSQPSNVSTKRFSLDIWLGPEWVTGIYQYFPLVYPRVYRCLKLTPELVLLNYRLQESFIKF